MTAQNASIIGGLEYKTVFILLYSFFKLLRNLDYDLIVYNNITSLIEKADYS